ncbi:hypothetical protein ACQP2H_23435 [Micromonospora sp. CA-248260]|uniref:hypothetical protein n=1 Tax=Micromonospora sp. CA-248260 TaxID=3239962 RepID=UPI003D8DFD44
MSLVRQLAALPTDRVVQIPGVPTGTVAATVTGEPVGPAAVVLQPGPTRTAGSFVHAVLDELERVAVGCYRGGSPRPPTSPAPTRTAWPPSGPPRSPGRGAPRTPPRSWRTWPPWRCPADDHRSTRSPRRSGVRG